MLGTSPAGFETAVPLVGDPDDISDGDVATTYVSDDDPARTTVIPISPENLPDPSVVAAVEEDGCGFSADFGALGRGFLRVGLLVTLGIVGGVVTVFTGLVGLRRMRPPDDHATDDGEV